MPVVNEMKVRRQARRTQNRRHKPEHFKATARDQS
jgi:hypothetical protein